MYAEGGAHLNQEDDAKTNLVAKRHWAVLKSVYVKWGHGFSDNHQASK